ncbi:CPXCG motif-containing cysteine-rich protein [bacterium]|nr:CPXCG motif-containing cysteine-rich protein [bacterium]
MQLQDEHAVACPYCGEPITLLVDHTGGNQRYVEDCFVCCQPIVVQVEVGAEVLVRVEQEGG